MSELLTSTDNDSGQSLAARCEELEREVERLQHRSSCMRQLVSNTEDFLYVFDLQYRFIYANRALLNVWAKHGPKRLVRPVWNWGIAMARCHALSRDRSCGRHAHADQG